MLTDIWLTRSTDRCLFVDLNHIWQKAEPSLPTAEKGAEKWITDILPWTVMETGSGAAGVKPSLFCTLAYFRLLCVRSYAAETEKQKVWLMKRQEEKLLGGVWRRSMCILCIWDSVVRDERWHPHIESRKWRVPIKGGNDSNQLALKNRNKINKSSNSHPKKS